MTPSPPPPNAAPSSPVLRFLRRPVLLTTLAISVGLWGVRAVGGLQGSELTNYDRFVRLTNYDRFRRWQGDEGPDQRLLVVGINEKDIQRRREDPLEDGTLADTLAALQVHNPRAIGVDIGRDLPQGPPEGRQRLLETIRNDDSIIMACLMSGPNFPGVPPPEGTPDGQVGFADFPIDPNGVVRRGLLFSVPERPPMMPAGLHLCNNSDLDFDLPAFSTLLALAYLQEEGMEIGATENLELMLGNRVIPTLAPNFGGYSTESLPPYQTMIRYRSPQNSVEVVGLEEVLAGAVPSELIRDRVVLIGYTSLVAKDLFLTPYLAAQEFIREMPGVIIHAQLTSQLIAAVLDDRPLVWSLPTPLEWGLIWLWGLGGGAIAYGVRRSGLVWLCLGVGSAATWGLAYWAFIGGAWLPVVPASLNWVICAMVMGTVKQATRQGYTQALYELIRGQLQEAAADTEHVDYLGALVHRAQSIRTGDEGLSSPQSAYPSSPADSVNLEDPEMQRILAEIRAQAIADFSQEQKAQGEPTSAIQRTQRQRQRRLEDLLARSRQVRTTLASGSSVSEGSGVGGK